MARIRRDLRPVSSTGVTTEPFGRFTQASSDAAIALNTELLTARDVAERLGVRPRWVTDKCREGLLPGYRLPGSNRLRFSWPDVLASLQRYGAG
jgi:hypothetical protein